MSLSSYYLHSGRHFARLRRRREYAPTSNTASHDNHEKIKSWVYFCFQYEYGAPLGCPSSRRSSAVRSKFCFIGITPKRLFPVKKVFREWKVYQKFSQNRFEIDFDKISGILSIEKFLSLLLPGMRYYNTLLSNFRSIICPHF